ncbi:hypothetical protein ACQR16_32920, partial [Bradyrhizobium oligotrophicum]|uniref:hypothetical protein n=1 Tax=Bradyrhizobium oligotrophicum TaxID=44255 RepID=UPI003EB74DF3
MIEALYPRVTEAIRRAESLDGLDAAAAIGAYLEVSLLEEQIALLLPPGDVEGAIARRGAVRAAISARDFARATELVSKFSQEPGVGGALSFELRALLQSISSHDPNQMTGAAMIVRALIDHGVQHLFG